MAAVTDEDLEKQFDIFGINLDDINIINALKDLSGEYSWDGEKLVEEWMAFSSAGSVDLTLKNIEEFKLKISSDKRNKKMTKLQVVKIMETKSDKIYNKDSVNELFMSEQDVGMLEMYQTPETKKSIKRLHTTPESGIKMLHTLTGRTPTTFSPVTPSPASATPAKRYEARDNAGEVVSTYNPSGIAENNINWGGHRNNLKVTLVEDRPLTEQFKYMFQKIADKTQVLNEHIDKMALILKETHKIEEFASSASINQSDVNVVGRINCDTNGRLNSSSIILRESGLSSQGQSVRLDVSNVNQYSLFPGQIAAMKGTSATGEQFVVSSFYEGVLPQSSKPQNSEPLSLFVAAGPFTTSDSLSYEPLTDFLKLIQKEEPDVVIMMGPFVDAKHSSIEKCEIDETFQQHFSCLMKDIGKIASSLSTKFLIIPSQRDANHDCVYPQPPFNAEDIISTSDKTEKKVSIKDIESLQFLADPCTVHVNGFSLGMTSTDILFHLGSDEIAHPPGSSDKMGRLVKHILAQQCYYPLYPPSEDVCIDYEMFAQHAHLPCKPDLLILPSDLRYFAKNVTGCLSVNPGRLTKGLVGGTYSRILLKRESLLSDAAAQYMAQIVRI